MTSIEVRDMNLDTTDMLLILDTGGQQTVKYDQIVKLECKDITVKKWFFASAKVKTIEIFLKGKEQSFIVRSDRFKAPFDSTSVYLKKFAEKNNVVIVS